MSLRIGTALFSLVLLVFVSTLGYTEEPEKTEKVLITGIGVDIDKAKQNAIRNAVERVIGAYVVSDTIVKNSQLLKDEILSYSGGYLKEMKIISQGQNEDGLFTVQIEAVVISTKLKRKLESLNIATKKIEGESLFGEAVSKINEQKDASSLLKETLSKFPQAAYETTFGKPEIKTINSTKNTAEVIIPLTIRWDAKFIAELKDIISKVSTETYESERIKSFLYSYVVCFSTKKYLKRKKAEYCGIIDSSLYKEAVGKDELNLIYGSSVSGGAVTRLSLFVSFKDKENNIIDTYNYHFDLRDRDSPKKQKIWQGRNLDFDSTLLATAFYENAYANFPNKLQSVGGTILLITDGEYNMNLEVELDAGKLESISTIEAQLSLK